MNTNYNEKYYDEVSLMVAIRKEVLLNKANKLDILEAARDNELELNIDYIMNLFENYCVVNTDSGFNLYNYINSDKTYWAYCVSFICADEDYKSFMVDGISYPYEGGINYGC